MTRQLPAATSCASEMRRDAKANDTAAVNDATATVYSTFLFIALAGCCDGIAAKGTLKDFKCRPTAW